MSHAETAIIPIGKIEQTILQIRGQKVILDADLAALYGTTTRVLNQAVRRNPERFPPDFIFRCRLLKRLMLSQIVITSDLLNIHQFSLTHSPNTELSWLPVF